MLTEELIPSPLFEEAVAACADQPEVICLDGGIQGWKYLCLPQESYWLRSVEDIPEPTFGAANTSVSSWPVAINGGWVIQCDYGMPVGSNAAQVRYGEHYAGRAARLDGWIAWDPTGRAWLSGDDVDALRALLSRVKPGHLELPAVSQPTPQWSAAEHMNKVETLREAIANGTCFQGNLAIPFRASWLGGRHSSADLALFMRLRELSPAPYAAFWRQPGNAVYSGRSICSHSPECFLQGDGTALRSEPIKGTRRRIAGSDEAVISELLASHKDRAELAMIVDLVRNDLGRIAQVGSVQVAAQPSVMSLDYIHHTYYRVDAKPQSNTGIREWLAASFPPGSITGAPKIEVMNLLQDLEGEERGPYCGCFGWIGQRSCALAVAIRTMYVQDNCVHFSAGGGIVADSDPLAEWNEVLTKADRMLAALTAAR